MSNSSRMPVPSAVISAWISVFWSTLSMRDFSTLRILPRSGSTACVERSRPCLAEPPAESPSTMKISEISGSLTMQSASLPGRPMPPIADLRAGSRALRGWQLHRDHRGQALADVLALEVLVLLLEDVLARVVVDRARQRRAEARHV